MCCITSSGLTHIIGSHETRSVEGDQMIWANPRDVIQYTRSSYCNSYNNMFIIYLYPTLFWFYKLFRSLIQKQEKAAKLRKFKVFSHSTRKIFHVVAKISHGKDRGFFQSILPPWICETVLLSYFEILHSPAILGLNEIYVWFLLHTNKI